MIICLLSMVEPDDEVCLNWISFEGSHKDTSVLYLHDFVVGSSLTEYILASSST
jgi:hypothetical protein